MKKWVTNVATHSRLTLILIAIISILSLFFIKDLNIEAFPDPAPPIIEVVTLFEGKPTEEIERRVTIPIEIAMAGMKGLEVVHSISLYGLSEVNSKFSHEISYTEARQQVINRLAMVKLPDGARPTIIPVPIGEVLRYEVAGSANLMELRGLQEWVISRHLKTAQGVEDATVVGGYVKTYEVRIYPEKLIKYNISLAEVIESLSKSNLNVGGRAIQRGEQFYIMRGLGRIKEIADIEMTKVAMRDNQPIFVKNIAEVAVGSLPQTGIVGLGHKDEIVMGTVVLRKGAKSIPSLRSIHEKIEELNARILPEGITLTPIYDMWDLIVAVIKKMAELAASGVMLVALTLIIFLGNIRAALITAMIIPISLLITFSIMSIHGESANLLSIGAIDFGIIADIPLILIENYFRISHRLGHGIRSIVKSSEEVSKPIIFSVMIILIAFIPIFNMKGAESQIFMPMAKTYLYTLVFTLTLTFTYLIAAKQLWLSGQSEFEIRPIAHCKDKYVALTRALLPRSRLFLFMAILAVGGIFTLGFENIGTQFLPKMDEGNIYVRINFPYSISLNKAFENAKIVRDILKKYPEIQEVNFKAGRPEDGTDPTGPFDTDYYAKLTPYNLWTRGHSKEDIENMIRAELKQTFPLADISIAQYIEDNVEEIMSGVKGENSIKLFGNDLPELDRIAEEYKNILKTIPDIVDVGIQKEIGQPVFSVEVDRENAALFGLSVEDILDTVATAIGSKTITEIMEGARMVPLLLMFPAEYRNDPEKIMNIPVRIPDGGMIPLSRVARARLESGAFFIYREHFTRFIAVKFGVSSKDLGGKVAQAQEAISKIKLPPGYFVEWGGMFNEMQRAFGRFFISVPVSLFLILGILYLFYKSVRNVLITMLAPLFCIAGGVLSLVIMDESLNVSSIVGFISIIGVSTLNASIMIDYYIHLISEGIAQVDAIMETVRDKFRPVLMSGLIAAIGLLPASLAQGVGSQIPKPLAVVVVGGMTIGTILILLLIPLMLAFVEISEDKDNVQTTE
jgi:cobalt-zinc-cadmium resistance protein CzcA